MNNIVWAVESGKYSDYEINGLFATQKLAKQFVKEHCPDGRVVEWEVITADALKSHVKRGTLYQVSIMPDGSRGRAREYLITSERYAISGYGGIKESPLECAEQKTTFILALMNGNYSGWPADGIKGQEAGPETCFLCTFVFAKDEQHAIKIGNERRIGVIQHPKWWEQRRWEMVTTPPQHRERPEGE